MPLVKVEGVIFCWLFQLPLTGLYNHTAPLLLLSPSAPTNISSLSDEIATEDPKLIDLLPAAIVILLGTALVNVLSHLLVD